MKSALHQTITIWALILGLALPLANSARGSVLRHEAPPMIVPSALENDSSKLAMGISLGFAMADFTGDTHPDLATVELDGFDSASAQYVIEVQLTEGGHQSLRVTAPFGGLLVTPKDLTGDGNVDLVVRSVKSHAPIAIFLNDGYGHFFAVEPSAFTKVLQEVPSDEKFASRHFYFSATVVSSRSYTIRYQGGSARDLQKQNGSLLSASYGAPSHLFLPFGLNRAPPAIT
jgi:hypothetical protein